MFYNTNNQIGRELRTSWANTKTQDEVILEIYELHETYDINCFLD